MADALARNFNSSSNTAVTEGSGARILIVEDDLSLREAIEDTLALNGYKVFTADSGEEALVVLKRESNIQCVITDVNMSGMDGHQLLREIKANYPMMPVILNTAYGSIDRSVEAMREGAVDYLVKPFEPSVLVETIAPHINCHTPSEDDTIARDPNSIALLDLAKRVAESNTTALIIGESGTGKEVLARYIHAHSSRANQPFVAINCAAIPENMLEGMLFGHEKGAFTGAYSSAPGKFEQANGGTLLLDEITEMDIGLQAKLLRVLQEREVERLGGRKTIKLDVRVIATSNRDMRESVVAGKFREDLYFRLSVLPLQWLPLRDRPADILPLAEKLLAKHAVKQYRGGVGLSREARDALLAYPWPGNVRELENVMQRALILQPGAVIYPQDLGLGMQMAQSQKPTLLDDRVLNIGAPSAGPQSDTLLTAVNASVSPVESSQLNDANTQINQLTNPISSGVTEGQSAMGATSSSVTAQPGLGQSGLVQQSSESVLLDDRAVLGDDLKQREFEIIVNTLRQERGSKKNTADRLGISPRTLRYKIARLKEVGLDINQFNYR